MRRFLDDTLNPLLVACLLLGCLPQVEVRHRHAHGRDSHHHHHHQADPHGAPADHFTIGSDHDHEDWDRTETDADLHVPLSPSRIAPAYPTLAEGEDWHVHSAWLGELLRGTLPVSNQGGSEVGHAVGAHITEFTSTPDRPIRVADRLVPALLMCLHGPPPRQGPIDPTRHLLRSLLDRRPSPLLCDAARHERSGVQLT